VKACNSADCSAFSAYRSVLLNSELDLLMPEPTDTTTDEGAMTRCLHGLIWLMVLLAAPLAHLPQARRTG
jgi:hypothetical protein